MKFAFSCYMHDLYGAFPAVGPRFTMLSLQLVVLVKNQVANHVMVAAQTLFMIGNPSGPLVDLHTDSFLSDSVQLG